MKPPKYLFKPCLPVIIAGSRDFNNYEMVKGAMDGLLEHAKQFSITIVSGGAPGADLLGERYAKERGFSLVRMPALWDYYTDKQAGYIRNGQMAMFVKALAVAGGKPSRAACVCFWDGKSNGTKHMLNTASQWQLRTFCFDANTGDMTKTTTQDMDHEYEPYSVDQQYTAYDFRD